MPWPTRTAKSIAERIAASLEANIQAAAAAAGRVVDPLGLSRAVRSARGMLAHIGRAVAAEIREVHDHIAWWGRQYFPDTAEEEFVYRHASIWGIEPRPATTAIGAVDIEGTPNTPLPAGIELVGSDGVLFVTTEAGAIAANGGTTITVAASAPGPAGNLEAGIRLATVTPFTGIDRVTVAGDGIAGGAAEATPPEITRATLAHIRQRPHGGAGFDYPTWLAAAFDVRAVKVVPEWIGRGSVGVVVAMKDGDFGRAPTAAELDAMQKHIGRFGKAEGVRPVTANAVLVAAEETTVPLTVRLRPDTVETRAAVTEAWTRFVATLGDEDDTENDSAIGATIEPSRVSEAISAASGEYAHDLIAPAAPTTLERTEYPLPGAPTFEDPE